MKQYKTILFLFCILFTITISCEQKQASKELNEAEEIEITENSKMQILSEAGKFKEKLDIIVNQLFEKKKLDI